MEFNESRFYNEKKRKVMEKIKEAQTLIELPLYEDSEFYCCHDEYAAKFTKLWNSGDKTMSEEQIENMFRYAENLPTEFMEILIEQLTDFDKKFHILYNMIASNPDFVFKIIDSQHIDVNYVPRYQFGAPLINNCTSYEIVKKLLDRGANPNIKDTHGTSPLMLFIDLHIMDLLVQSGADVNAICTGYGECEKSVIWYHVTIPNNLRYLIEKGADPHYYLRGNLEDESLLMELAKYPEAECPDNIESIKILLANDVREGLDEAIEIAKKEENLQIEQMLQKAKDGAVFTDDAREAFEETYFIKSVNYFLKHSLPDMSEEIREILSQYENHLFAVKHFAPEIDEEIIARGKESFEKILQVIEAEKIELCEYQSELRKSIAKSRSLTLKLEK